MGKISQRCFGALFTLLAASYLKSKRNLVNTVELIMYNRILALICLLTLLVMASVTNAATVVTFDDLADGLVPSPYQALTGMITGKLIAMLKIHTTHKALLVEFIAITLNTMAAGIPPYRFIF
ncbi:hypothetical protein [Methylocucumis oryzae]|uniref:Uncharacterized protein n=1 Tax=Methylocucumis oryzae TaxID=1632867 RepID=A0A0F3IHM3_9GAMM|nr:hypothetical protein [Methylocucumis oryzae]KJV06295.1 hypothetical protein VZ94_12230 [Methylocucumis oryzae]